MNTPVKHKSGRYDNTEKPHCHCVNVNPVRRHTVDCVIRAIALFLQWTWTDNWFDLGKVETVLKQIDPLQF